MADDKAIEANIPVEVEYDGYDKEEFEFVIEKLDGSTSYMPENTSISIEDKGSFGPIDFDIPGKYQYLIKQVPTDKPIITYDERVYHLDIYLQYLENGNKSISMVIYGENGEKVPKIKFVNKRKWSPNPVVPDKPDKPDPEEPIPDQPKNKEVNKKTNNSNPKMGVESVGLSIVILLASILALFLLTRKRREI
nr:FctA domain-containing protein [Anaerococcus sp. AGMB09787]